jgi:hypothetical protein
MFRTVQSELVVINTAAYLLSPFANCRSFTSYPLALCVSAWLSAVRSLHSLRGASVAATQEGPSAPHTGVNSGFLTWRAHVRPKPRSANSS